MLPCAKGQMDLGDGDARRASRPMARGNNMRAPDGELVKGGQDLVEWVVRVAEVMCRTPVKPDEARGMMRSSQSRATGM